MGFFTPWFLACAAAVGLPVWLHLLRKHKTTPLPFSSLMFFEKRTQSSIKHKRLRYLVLFAARTLLRVVPAALVSGPAVRGLPRPPFRQAPPPAAHALQRSHRGGHRQLPQH